MMYLEVMMKSNVHIYHRHILQERFRISALLDSVGILSPSVTSHISATSRFYVKFFRCPIWAHSQKI